MVLAGHLTCIYSTCYRKQNNPEIHISFDCVSHACSSCVSASASVLIDPCILEFIVLRINMASVQRHRISLCQSLSMQQFLFQPVCISVSLSLFLCLNFPAFSFIKQPIDIDRQTLDQSDSGAFVRSCWKH